MKKREFPRKPLVVASAIRKGGTGKTTIIALLAHWMLVQGFRVLIVDTDPQKNCSKLFVEPEDLPENAGASALFESVDAPVLPAYLDDCFVVPADDALDEPRAHDNILAFRKNLHALAVSLEVDVVLVDTPPSSSQKFALASADFAFSPMLADEYSIDGIEKLLKTVSEVIDAFNPDLTYLGLLVNKFNRSRQTDQDLLADVQEIWGSHLIPHVITDNAPINRFSKTRVPPWHESGGASQRAFKDLRGAFEWILDRMEGKAHD